MTMSLTSALAACALTSCSAVFTMTTSAESSMMIQEVAPGDGSTQTWVSDDWLDRVPREPLWVISAGNSTRDSNYHPENNAQGLAPWWRGANAVNNLMDRIQDGYDVGARWFFINRPMGTPGDTHVPGASWLTLGDDKREALPKRLADELLDHFNEPVHIIWFVGSNMTDPRDFPGWNQANADAFYEVGRNRTWEEVIGSRITLGGWISTGASGIAIDHSAEPGESEHFIALAQKLGDFPFSINVYGEAYPLARNVHGAAIRDSFDTPVLDQSAVRAMPWICNLEYFESRWPDFESTQFPIDPDSTRLFVWFDKGSEYFGNQQSRINFVNRYMDYGLIPITNDSVMFGAALNRLRYGMGSPQTNTGGGDDEQETNQAITSNSNGGGSTTSTVGYAYGSSLAGGSGVGGASSGGGGGGGGSSGGGGGGGAGGGNSPSSGGGVAATAGTEIGTTIVTVRSSSSQVSEVVETVETTEVAGVDVVD